MLDCIFIMIQLLAAEMAAKKTFEQAAETAAETAVEETSKEASGTVVETASYTTTETAARPGIRDLAKRASGVSVSASPRSISAEAVEKAAKTAVGGSSVEASNKAPVIAAARKVDEMVTNKSGESTKNALEMSSEKVTEKATPRTAVKVTRDEDIDEKISPNKAAVIAAKEERDIRGAASSTNKTTVNMAADKTAEDVVKENFGISPKMINELNVDKATEIVVDASFERVDEQCGLNTIETCAQNPEDVLAERAVIKTAEKDIEKHVEKPAGVTTQKVQTTVPMGGAVKTTGHEVIPEVKMEVEHTTQVVSPVKIDGINNTKAMTKEKRIRMAAKKVINFDVFALGAY